MQGSYLISLPRLPSLSTVTQVGSLFILRHSLSSFYFSAQKSYSLFCFFQQRSNSSAWHLRPPVVWLQIFFPSIFPSFLSNNSSQKQISCPSQNALNLFYSISLLILEPPWGHSSWLSIIYLGPDQMPTPPGSLPGFPSPKQKTLSYSSAVIFIPFRARHKS